MKDIQFVSLGPGEPELVTIKGLRTLQNADCIFCPATIGKDGKHRSRAKALLLDLGISPEQIRTFGLPMNKDRDQALEAYDQIYESALVFQQQDKQVAIVAEGDSGFYSSIHYIYDRLRNSEKPVSCIPGVPAFIAAGAMIGLHIASQEERMIVIPGIVTCTEQEDYLKQKTVVVLMKLSLCTDEVHACIDKHPEYKFHYFENVGTENEYYSQDTHELQTKSFPYFSLMIIRYSEES